MGVGAGYMHGMFYAPSHKVLQRLVQRALDWLHLATVKYSEYKLGIDRMQEKINAAIIYLFSPTKSELIYNLHKKIGSIMSI